MINIKINSKLVEKGDTFVALVGSLVDGHEYINDAIKNGATKIVCEKGNYDVETIIVPDTHKYLNEYLYNTYYNEIKDVKLIGYTGTNGKTTSCYLIYQALKKLNKKCAYIGTIGFFLDDEVVELNNTTPSVLDVYDMILTAKDKDCEYVVMEVTSVALDQQRVYNLEFDACVFTNLTNDHLDYHKTFDNYASCKAMLFNMLRNKKSAILNGDDEFYNLMKIEGNNNITYGYNESTDFSVINEEILLTGTKFDFEYNNETYSINSKLVGKYNVYNLLSVIIVLHELNFDFNNIIKVANELKAPKGRTEQINYNNNIIVIDYAHTPDAVFQILDTFNKVPHNNIYTIVGCGGNRSTDKRPIMADIACKYSTKAIFTSDNPRNEDPKLILDDMIYEINHENYEVIIDRKDAIIHGVSLLNENDILLILGKGHEEYQIIGDVKHHFSDFEEVEKIVKGSAV